MHAAAAPAPPPPPLPLPQSYSSGGTTGWFSRQLTGDRIPFVMAHLVHVIGGYSNKQNVRRAYEHYHWEVVQQLQAPLHSVGVPFSISTTSHPEPLVLGYTPRLQGECTSTEDDFKAAVVALATAAAVLQRAVAYPYLPCGCPWVTTNGGEGIKQRSLPLNLANSRYLPIESGWSNLTCIWGSYLWAKCVKVHPPHWPGALVPVEVDYYNKLLQKRGKQPVTLQLGAGGAAESVTAEQLREAVRGAGGESAQVLLLDGVVTVTDAPKPITTAIKELMGRNHGEGECFQHVL